MASPEGSTTTGTVRVRVSPSASVQVLVSVDAPLVPAGTGTATCHVPSGLTVVVPVVPFVRVPVAVVPGSAPDPEIMSAPGGWAVSAPSPFTQVVATSGGSSGPRSMSPIVMVLVSSPTVMPPGARPAGVASVVIGTDVPESSTRHGHPLTSVESGTFVVVVVLVLELVELDVLDELDGLLDVGEMVNDRLTVVAGRNTMSPG